MIKTECKIKAIELI